MDIVTTGMLMFYGGIAGACFFAILLLILLPVFGKQRKRMLEKIGGSLSA